MVCLMNRSIDIWKSSPARMQSFPAHRGATSSLRRSGSHPEIHAGGGGSGPAGAGPVRYHTGGLATPNMSPRPRRFRKPADGIGPDHRPEEIREHFPYSQTARWPSSIPAVAGISALSSWACTCSSRPGNMAPACWQAASRAYLRRAIGSKRCASPRPAAPPACHAPFRQCRRPFPAARRRDGRDGTPVFHELHIKVAFRDPLRKVARTAPLLIWSDPTFLPWSEEERALLAESDETRTCSTSFRRAFTRVLRRIGQRCVLILWTYDVKRWRGLSFEL